MPRLKTLILLTLAAVSLCATPSMAFFFGPTGPNPNLEKIKTLSTELKERTGTVWNEIDKHVDLLLKHHHAVQQLTPAQVNAMSEQYLAQRMEERLQWAKKFEELRNFLAEEYGLFIEKVKSSDLDPAFKEEVVKHYDGPFRDAARENMYPYLNGMENTNEALFEMYKMISFLRFPAKSENKAPEDLNEERLNLLKGAVTEETIEKIKNSRRTFFEFLNDFSFNPLEDNVIYQAGQALYARDEKLQKKLLDQYIDNYFDGGAAKAEATLKYQAIGTLNAELAGALPKASGESLVKYAAEDMDILKKLASGSTGDNTKSCLLFADAQEFVGVDYNKIVNDFYFQEAPWKVKGLFPAANDILASAQTTPADFSAGREQAAQLLELARKSALGAIRDNAVYKRFMKKNKYSPRRYCFMRFALMEELLKLPSPAREDTLRLLYLEDLEKKVKNATAAPQKK